MEDGAPPSVSTAESKVGGNQVFVIKGDTEFWLISNKLIRQSGMINALGCKIKIPSPWNVQLFRELLVGYHDQGVVDFMEFGWPIDVCEVEKQKVMPVNQAGARNNLVKVKKYVEEELAHGTVIGPFKDNPLGGQARFSPLDAIPKRDSDEMRIIMNLSYPHDETSVNSRLDKHLFLGEEVSLVYPSVEDLVKIIKKKGRSCLLFKHDLWKCYRQIVMDPGSIHFLEFIVDSCMFFDVVLSMGLRIACFICQRIMNALMFLYRRLSYEGINYLDDLGAAELRDRVWQAFVVLGRLLDDLGICEAEAKVAPPAEVMVFLGVNCNSRLFTLEITPDRLQEILSLVNSWMGRDNASLQEVQSLAGKLNFVCSTVRAGRVFVSRVLQFLRSFKGKPGKRIIPEETKKDLKWWSTFLTQFNGVTMFPELRWSPPDNVISTDSCLTGCGGWSEGEYFHAEFPADILVQGLTINELECLAVVLAVKLWLQKLVNRNVLMFCDNKSTVMVINKGSARNRFTQACLRELAWLSACNNSWIKMCFVQGLSNRISDSLSRWHLHPRFKQTFLKDTEGKRIKELVVGPQDFKFGHEW